MSDLLHNIFQPDNREEAERAKFLSRVFGIFSEKIVSLWCQDERSSYENLGRPTVKFSDAERGYVLDFTLRDRTTGALYVAEMKCEIEYQGFRYFILNTAAQFNHQKKPAFEAFLRSAQPSDGLQVWVGRRRVMTAGAIIIWGAVTENGRASAKEKYGLTDALSLSDMCKDLVSWDCQRYKALLEKRRAWCNALFSGLAQTHTPPTT